MCSAIDAKQREPLVKVFETILKEDEQRMSHIFSSTSISIKFGKDKREKVETKKVSPKGDGISEISFNIALDNGLHAL